jgi:hypothetical protein
LASVDGSDAGLRQPRGVSHDQIARDDAARRALCVMRAVLDNLNNSFIWKQILAHVESLAGA